MRRRFLTILNEFANVTRRGLVVSWPPDGLVQSHFERRRKYSLGQTHKFHELDVFLSVGPATVDYWVVAGPVHNRCERVSMGDGGKPLAQDDRMFRWIPMVPRIHQFCAKALPDSKMDVMYIHPTAKLRVLMRDIDLSKNRVGIYVDEFSNLSIPFWLFESSRNID